jgi:hypothetical protein
MLAALVLCSARVGTCAHDAAYDLTPLVEPGQIRRVRVVLEVSGNLQVKAEDRQVTDLPLRIKGDLLYDERLLSNDEQTECRTDVRFYEQASAEFRVGEVAHRQSLGENHRLVLAHTTAERVLLFSPLGPLSRDDLELLDIQASSTLLPDLLPDKKTALGEEWSHDAPTLGALLGLDAVTQSSVKSRLRQAEGSLAIIDLTGTVSGAVRGVASDIQLRGKYNFDLDARRITWLTLAITEKRAPGHAEPGLDILARLRLATDSAPPRPELDDSALEGLPLDPTPGAVLLRFASADGGFQFLHGRQWRTIIDRHDAAVLRLVEQGDLIAQCNASRLPDLPAGQRVQMEAYKSDIRRALGDNFGQFDEVSQSTTGMKLNLLRAVVSGASSDVPIRWVYYHLSDDQGHQIATVFTMDARLIERFAEADRTLVETLEFTASGPTSAENSPPQPEGVQTATRPPADSPVAPSR